MLEYLNSFLPIIIYILLVILLVLLIIICFKTIRTMNKVQDIVEDVDDKVQSLNGFFDIIDMATDKLSILSDKVIDTIANFIQKVFKPRKKGNVEEEIDNE